jgi:hypothetical protein
MHRSERRWIANSHRRQTHRQAARIDPQQLAGRRTATCDPTNRSPSPAAPPCANTFVLHGNSFETTARRPPGPAGSPPEAPPPASALCAGESRCAAPSHSCAARLIVGPALIARPTKPGVELVLNGALDDQPRPQPGQLRQRSRGLSPTPTASNWSICSSISADGVPCVSRRRSSFFVLSGLEGTYAVPLTGPGHLKQLGDATARGPRSPRTRGRRSSERSAPAVVLPLCGKPALSAQARGWPLERHPAHFDPPSVESTVSRLARRDPLLPAFLQLAPVGADQFLGGAEGRVAADEREVVVAEFEQVGLRVAGRLWLLRARCGRSGSSTRRSSAEAGPTRAASAVEP